MNSRTLFALIGTADGQMLERSERASQKRRRLRGKRTLILIAAVFAALAITMTAVAVTGGTNALCLILSAFSQTQPEGIPDQAVIRAQLDSGQWVWLDGGNIAVIVPESPVRILLSSDGGTTWKQSTVTGSDTMQAYGSLRSDVQYFGGFIGFFGDGGGYLVLTASVSMNNQPMRIYLTADGGDTWSEIGSPYDVHASVLTGAGFSTPEIGFISYRYYEDAGPDIWRTTDGGESWERMQVCIPAAYCDCSFLPQSPTFNGPDGVYPIVALHNGEETTIYMESHDYGLTWEFE